MNYLIMAGAFVLALIVSFCATPVVKKLAYQVGAIDVPKDNRRMHKKPIPRLGGLAIFCGFLVAVVLFVPLSPQFLAVLAGAAVIVVLGAFDDVYALGAKFKFLVQVVAACIPVIFGGVRIEAITNFLPFGGPYIVFGVFAIPITIFWIVGITNAVNLIDGLDGLAVGVSSIASISLLVIAVLVADPYVAMVMAALAGGCIGFLPYNFNPAKIFMGDTGALFLGYILSVFSIQGLFKFYAVLSFAVPFLILGLPIFDTAFAILRRVAKGQSPMQPDRGHLHHRLIDMGFSQKQTVAILYAMSGLLGLSAVILTGSGAMKTILLLLTVIVVAAIVYVVFYMGKDKEEHPEELPPEPTEKKEE
jgi:UDP-GlcNAc:undecaprenyl-phosphate GlcNAc-1-phosphate transferase